MDPSLGPLCLEDSDLNPEDEIGTLSSIRQSGRVLALQGYGIAGSLTATTEGTVTSRIY